jgi:hypothetical protein
MWPWPTDSHMPGVPPETGKGGFHVISTSLGGRHHTIVYRGGNKPGRDAVTHVRLHMQLMQSRDWYPNPSLALR